MPKLSEQQAAKVQESEALQGGFLLDPGRYAARLRACEEQAPKPGKEYPYWIWEFEGLHDEAGKQYPGRQWYNSSLSPDSAGFLKAIFEAFGYTADSDTDELLGEWVVLYLEVGTQQEGKNAGKRKNEITRFAEFDAAEWEFDPSTVTVREKGAGRATAGASANGGGAKDDF